MAPRTRAPADPTRGSGRGRGRGRAPGARRAPGPAAPLCLGPFSATPKLAGDLLEVWGFVDRFRDALFAPPELRDDDDDDDGGATRRARRPKRKSERGVGPDERARRGGGAANALGARGGVGIRRRGVRAAALVGAMLTPLLASHARGQPSTTLADAVALAPLVDAAATVPGNAWEETLRRYFRGAAAAMETPPEGATFRAASDASEVVCKWIVTGGPTALATAPDGGQSTAPTPAAAAAMAATLESVPRPYCALSARADAEAMAACEIELYAAGAESGSGEDDDVEQRRRRATELARAAATMPEVAAVRQSVRVLAHSDAFRHPALGRKAAREAGNAASSVPYYAATAAGAGASAAARAKFPRAVDYETIDARAAAGVYAVAELTVGAEAMVSVDAAECGELVRAAGAPDRSASHAVPSKIERACRKGAPEGACAGDGHVVIDGGQYTLFGAETAKLPKVAWDDGCVVCGGDVNAGVVLLCEGCDSEYHCGCLSPPLAAVPEGEWFCPACERARAADDDEARTPLDPRFAALEGTALARWRRGRRAADRRARGANRRVAAENSRRD